MSNPYSALLDALSLAPETQIDAQITARLHNLAKDDAVSSAALKAILDECARYALASDGAMVALHGVWKRLRADEGLPDPDDERRAQAEAAMAAYRAEALTVTVGDLESALFRPEPGTSTSAALVAVLRSVQALLATGRAAALDGLLATLQLDGLPTVLAVGLLRYTFAARAALPNWEVVRDRTRAALDTRGEDAGRLLRGL